jgi:glycosyltransferase involved in cell wall biosynthesis
MEESMKRVLIPTNDSGYVYSLAKSYHKLNYEPTLGAMNFDLCVGSYDFVHFLWPEEFSSWRPPSNKALSDIKNKLDWWRRRSPLIISVQNFYPHDYENDSTFKELYSIFYSSCSGIVHTSRASLELINKEFPITTTKPNIVTKPFNYDYLLKDEVDRDSLRRDFGFGKADFVILVFGRLRKWEEVRLLQRAYAKAKIRQKRLLLVARFRPVHGYPLFQRILWWSWKRILRTPRKEGFIPDEDVYKYCEAADAIVIPRFNDLNTGLIGLGMTFGKMIVAPEHGAFPDYLEGTENLLYKSGDPKSMALALEKASVLDRERIGQKNREIARSWSMDNIARAFIDLAENVKDRL